MPGYPVSEAFRDDEEDVGEFRKCIRCGQIFWAEWDNNDQPNTYCPSCGSAETSFVCFEWEDVETNAAAIAVYPAEGD